MAAVQPPDKQNQQVLGVTKEKLTTTAHLLLGNEQVDVNVQEPVSVAV